MKDLIIVGAGNAAREILQFARDINRLSPRWNIAGFIADSGLDINSLTNGDYDVIGTINDWNPKENEVFACAIANPADRENVVQKLLEKGAEFVNIIHPTALVNDYSRIGRGMIMYPFSFVGPNAEIGDFVFLQRFSSIPHDATIGSFSTVSSLCGLGGGVNIGQRVFFGTHVTLIPKISVGNDAFIGAGSVVVQNVEAGSRVFGNPAKKISF